MLCFTALCQRVAWPLCPAAFRGEVFLFKYVSLPLEGCVLCMPLAVTIYIRWGWQHSEGRVEGTNCFENCKAAFVCNRDDGRRLGILLRFKCQLVNKILAFCLHSFVLRQRMLLKNETKMTNLTFPRLFIVVSHVNSPFRPWVTKNQLLSNSSKMLAYFTSTVTYWPWVWDGIYFLWTFQTNYVYIAVHRVL